MLWPCIAAAGLAGAAVAGFVVLRRWRSRTNHMPEALAEEATGAEQAEECPLATPDVSRQTGPQFTTREHRHLRQVETVSQAGQIARLAEPSPQGPAERAEVAPQPENAEVADVETKRGDTELTEARASPERDRRRIIGARQSVSRGRIDPLKRGGRPRTPEQDEIDRQDSGVESSAPKAEIVCWESNRRWTLGVELPEASVSDGYLEASQDGVPLEPDETRDGCWALRGAAGEITVRIGSGQVVSRATLGQEENSHLLFRLNGQDQGEGRKVETLSSGWYLVVVPEEWVRDESDCPAPVAPQTLSIPGYLAHFLHVRQGSVRSVEFRTGSAGVVRIAARKSPFDLVGRELDDGDENAGPLFIGEPPRISVRDAELWDGVAVVVIGEEGRGRGKWRTHMKPIPGVPEQPLPTEFVSREGGWYFLRFYDLQSQLVESFDFRFAPALRGFDVPPFPRLPAPTGHGTVNIVVDHDSNCVVSPASDLAGSIQVGRRETTTTLSVPPDPDCDRSEWLVAPDHRPQVRVTFLVERVWWAVGDENAPPAEWIDKPANLRPGDFAATGSRALWFRLPRTRWTDALQIGFKESGYRSYPVKVLDTFLCVPLRDFRDAEELRTIGQSEIRVVLGRRGGTTATVAIATSMAACKWCEFSGASEKEVIGHVAKHHTSALFRRLTYDDLSAQDRRLPRKIYRCEHCCEYVSADDPTYPESAICKHVQEEHHDLHMSFEVVKDIDEIRRTVLPELPRVVACAKCGSHIREGGRPVIEHWSENHRRELIEIR